MPKALFLGWFEDNRGKCQAGILLGEVPKYRSAARHGHRRKAIWFGIQTRILRILAVACAQRIEPGAQSSTPTL